MSTTDIRIWAIVIAAMTVGWFLMYHVLRPALGL